MALTIIRDPNCEMDFTGLMLWFLQICVLFNQRSEFGILDINL
jgi:hypothetical protein